MNELRGFLPFLVPVLILQLGLTIGAWVHIYKSERFKTGNRLVWNLVALISIIGPVIYFAVGRETD